jgi:purine-binding chemotaxis protein CheW
MSHDQDQIQSRQFSTFFVDERMYGIEVTQVQEIAKPLPLTAIHLAPSYVCGLINLRGQIATAIELRGLFGLKTNDISDKMSVVCKHEGALLSLLVDRIGEVIEVSDLDFEPSPQTIDESNRQFMRGVYKTPDSILSVIEINKIFNYLSK